jgi:glucose-1-phosphate thymidylyltransferase
MKAIITAGGHGTRLRPLTYTLNKHLFPIANKPMIFYALEKIKEAGVKEVAININEGDKDIRKVLGGGEKWNLKITYLEQKGGALGVAHVIKNAEKWLAGSDLLFYLGDNIILGSLKGMVEEFKQKKLDCLLALSQVPDPERFGVPVMKNGKIIKVEEKPKKPQSNYVVTGIYIYSKKVLEAVNNIKESNRGELEISDAHTYLIKKGARVGYKKITGWWKDTGKPEDLLEGNSLVLSGILKSNIQGSLDKEARLEGKVIIGKGTKIGKKVLLRGPIAIGKNCKIENSSIEPYTAIADNCTIEGAEIHHSIICEGSQIINCPKRITDSLIGRNCLISSENSSKPSGHRLVIGDNAQVEL